MGEERTDRDLVSAGNRGDRTALEALYRRHRDWVYGHCLTPSVAMPCFASPAEVASRR